MRRVTFLIGNGFDINVGLATSYREFCKFYIEKCPDDMIAQDMKERQKDQFWSDIESGLGKYTDQIRFEDKGNFLASEQNLEKELKEYLMKQCSRVKILNQKQKMGIAEEMNRSLRGFYKELTDWQRTDIDEKLKKSDHVIIYSFISFNYTNILERFIDIAKEMGISPFRSLGRGKKVFMPEIDQLIYIHGTIDTELVLGVNDVSQIANVELHHDQILRKLLIKKEAVQHQWPDRREKAGNMIAESQIVCIFGMSIGETDRSWWEHICRWMQEDDSRRLIIFVKTEGLARLDVLMGEDNAKRKLKRHSGVSDEVWKKIEEHIYVKCNPHIFNFELVE